MARLTCSRSGWGTVRDPETGDRIAVDADVSLDQGMRLADEYGPIEVVAEPDPEPEPTCAGSGGDCSRPVDEAGGRCWQHIPE